MKSALSSSIAVGGIDIGRQSIPIVVRSSAIGVVHRRFESGSPTPIKESHFKYKQRQEQALKEVKEGKVFTYGNCLRFQTESIVFTKMSISICR
jgi:hypothetical protein